MKNVIMQLRDKSLTTHQTYKIDDKLKHISSEIETSKYILELEESWDDEGALSVPQFVWERGISFLLNYSIWINKNHETVIDTPEINPCKDGSVDLVWRNTNARFLINFKNQKEIAGTYYGDEYNNKNRIKNAVDNVNQIDEVLAIWMKKLVKINE